MSHTFLTRAITLSFRDDREADRLYHVFSDTHGKLVLRAKGSRKISSKLASHLEPFAVSEILVVRGRYQDIVAGVERQRAFAGLRRDWQKTSLACDALQCVDICTREQQSDLGLFRELEQWLGGLEASPVPSITRAGFLRSAFALRLLSLLGYRPELSRCLGCRGSLVPGGYRWHGLKGGTVCRGCTERSPERWFAARDLCDESLKLLRLSLESDVERLFRIRLPGFCQEEYYDLVESLALAHFPVLPPSFHSDDAPGSGPCAQVLWE
jgi:DNA repair protein RecO (recombination protein O)